jgi:hypothetical protein
MITPRKRGRPPTFTPAQRKQFAKAIRKHGVRQTCATSPIPVSMKTLLKIAHDFKIELKPGRRPKQAA